MYQRQFPLWLLLLGSLSAQGAPAADGQENSNAPRAQPAAAAPVSVSVNARALGMGEALLDYCAQNDPKDAGKVRARLKRLAQGASSEALAAARQSADYRSAHEAEADFLSKVDPHNASRVCSAGDGAKRAK
jgi:hypothetical protein